MGTFTYNGSTAGSTLANPPVLLHAAVGGHVLYATSGFTSATTGFPNLPSSTLGPAGAKVWFYSSTNIFSDIFGTLNAFGDGVALGMSNGDLLIGVQTSAFSTAPFCYFGVLCSSLGATGVGLSSACLSSTAV